jgi:hypothetical protein
MASRRRRLAAARFHLSIDLTIDLASPSISEITPLCARQLQLQHSPGLCAGTEPRCAVQSVYDLSSTKPAQIGIVYVVKQTLAIIVVPGCKRNREPMYADQ